jgi:hypothetical protein
MTKKATLTGIGSGFQSGTTLDANFDALNDKFDNTISRDGSTPNDMEADLDLGGNDLLNVGDVATSTLTVNGATFVPNDAVSVPDWEGPWTAFTSYSLNDLVSNEGSSYICTEAHTSGTFSADLAASKWELFAQKGSAGAGTGDMLAANNLSDVSNVATSRANLGLGTMSTQSAASVNVTGGTLDGVVVTNATLDVATETSSGVVEKSTSAENTTGTATDKYPDVAGVKEMIDTFAPGFPTPNYIGESVALSSNTTYTFTHGLGAIPTNVYLSFICVNATRGWLVGDEMPFLQGTENYNADVSPSIAINSTSIKVRIDGTNGRVVGMDGSSRSQLTPSDWKIKVRAWS